MARRTTKPFFVELVSFASLIPWYVSLILAGVTYGVFHYMAALPQRPSTGLLDFGESVIRQLIVTGSGFLQYLIPLCLLIGLVLSFFKRKYRRRLIEEQNDIDSIRNLSWQDFEKIVGEAFRLQGYAVTEVGGGGPDDGVDLVLRKDGQTTLVQCKNWRKDSISVSIVRELLGVMTAHRVPLGIVVCSGNYTNEATAFAESSHIQLIDGPQLLEMVLAVQPVTKRVQIEPTGSFQNCPVCGSQMVPRVAKRGANSGGNFLGCIEYPRCRGTRTI